MHLEEQTFWLDLVNLAASWRGDEDVARFIPERYRDFESSPQWTRRKAFAFLVNNLDVLRDAHRRLEEGRPLEYELLNNILGDCRLRLFDWGDAGAITAIRRSKANRGARLETLQAVGTHDGLNPGSTFIRASVERAFFYFAQYVDDRLADPVYPDSSPQRLRILPCARDGCRRLFIRTDRSRHHCGPGCESSR
jgi:hypothetical protein